MSRIRVLVVAAAAFAACRGASGCGGNESAPKATGATGGTVSAMGVVSGVQPDQVQVKTSDGRRLALRMRDDVKVTLAGGEAQSAVITEGAPVRVSYKPSGDGGELVAVDVEPKTGGGDAKESAAGEQNPAPQRDLPADAGRARQGG